MDCSVSFHLVPTWYFYFVFFCRFYAVHTENVKALKAMMVRQMSQIGVHSPASLLTNRVLVEVNRHITTQRITPLIIACLTGNSHTAKILLENGANANDCDATVL